MRLQKLKLSPLMIAWLSAVFALFFTLSAMVVDKSVDANGRTIPLVVFIAAIGAFVLSILSAVCAYRAGLFRAASVFLILWLPFFWSAGVVLSLIVIKFHP